MDLETKSFGVTELFNSLPKCKISGFDFGKVTSNDDDDLRSSMDENFNVADGRTSVTVSICQDDRTQLVASLNRFFQASSEPLDRSILSRLVHLCCVFDSVDCASALLSGELKTVPLVNEMSEMGQSALHTAAESHSSRCVELLLKKRARTDLRTKDGSAQLALELSLSSTRMDVIWNPDTYSVQDLVTILGQKDLTTVRLLAEKTKEIAEVAFAKAVEGRIVALGALLMVAAEKINESVLEFRDTDSGSKEKMTIYECVLREAMSLDSATAPSEMAKHSCSTDSENAKKRKLLLREIELLQLAGVVAHSSCTDKKVTSLLIRAVQAGDEAVTELLLKTDIDINDVDVDGNSALHWSLKAPRGSCLQNIKFLWLLLKHGARVNQRNKLGLTALHVAASNGNSQALQVLLLEDPDGINYKTEMKETPLFYAVKNEHINCVELLLRWGASSEVFNLRRQRPIDLAESQDMRFMLNPANISLMSRDYPIQQMYAPSLQGDDEVFLDTCKALLNMTDENIPPDRICSSAKGEICKYFTSARGCGRGDKCFFLHGEEEHQQVKQGTQQNHSRAIKEFKRKIFVGGLPLSVNSDLLGKLFEEQFGSVEDAIVIVAQIGSQTQSRGFGFVTFKEEKSALAAVQAHYVSIMDRQVEIKSIITKCLPLAEAQKLSPKLHEQEKNYHCHSPPQIHNDKIVEEAKPEESSWVDKLLNGQPKTCSNESQRHEKPGVAEQSMPTWLRLFKKWLPCFLKELSKRPKEGDYALSSLKRDFRDKFDMELDHASLGYSKLSDFMKCFSDLCSMKVVPIGSHGPATHMVLLPNPCRPHQVLHKLTMPCSPHATSIGDGEDGNSNDSKSLQDLTSGSSGSVSPAYSRSEEENPFEGYSEVNSTQTIRLTYMQNRCLKFLKQDPCFHVRPWLGKTCDVGSGDSNDGIGECVEGVHRNSIRHQRQHLVLEALARKRKNLSVYFLREFDFYKNYKESVTGGKCFGCNERKMLWANFPCQHLLWCSDCREKAILVGGAFAHKCVVCDVEVQKIALISTSI
ncbi:uncharacterized protein LOC107415561 isoform X2 [Ziziphus jujuba]|uniref:Uncharacterized protein LOC107415561 isoform X2 n=1 Tax=Ziziphus jujuba TaxID=326968 RepID=A0A6P3ZV66_ZIZJJ|nr:uncharacterized protein LOC107415561 isoform X2 [Ziziphus jujuba]